MVIVNTGDSYNIKDLPENKTTCNHLWQQTSYTFIIWLISITLKLRIPVEIYINCCTVWIFGVGRRKLYIIYSLYVQYEFV